MEDRLAYLVLCCVYESSNSTACSCNIFPLYGLHNLYRYIHIDLPLLLTRILVTVVIFAWKQQETGYSLVH